jgi:hypothetical protein
MWWRFGSLVLLLGGCDLFPLEDGDPPLPADSPDARPVPDAAPPPPPDAGEVAAAPRPGYLVSPRNGDVVVGSLEEAGLQLRGYTSTPQTAVSLQVLQYGPGLTLPARWVTFGGATSSATPVARTAAAPLYLWFSTASPASDRTWAVGGLLRLRAIDGEGRLLHTFDTTVDECLDARPDGGALAEDLAACRTGLPDLAIVHAGGAPENVTRFLDLEGLGNPTETAAYYAAIDAPATLDDFRERFGFGEAQNGEALAIYYNAGDLGIGREMHCRAFQTTGVACYVSNYGEFGRPLAEALDDTVARRDSFATVAMVYRPPISAPDSVQFLVYGGNGALATSAPLDTHGDNPSIPQNCLNCHGAQSLYDPVTHRVIGGARFLPFDPGAFVFPDVAGLRRADQEESLRRLNVLVDRAGPTAATRELIAAMYGGPGKVDVANTRANEAAIPAGWAQTAADRALYTHVIRPYCRACHVSQEPLAARSPIDFASAASFRALAPQVATRICGPHAASNQRMPNAEVPLRAFWQSPARAYLVGHLGTQGMCLP